MSRIFDIHCHILPGVDDGSQEMETTRQMLTIAWEDGITDMIATPHFQPGRFHTTVEEWKALHEKVQEEARKIDPDFQIHLGSELLGSAILEQELSSGRAITMCGSRYVLVEYHPETGFSEIKTTLSRIMQNGYWPILAHVERYQCIAKDWRKVEDLIDMGVFIQVNAGSIMGDFGWGTKFFARKLLKYELIHFIASDAHSIHRRKPALSEALGYIEKKCGTDYARALAYKNPEMILKNQLIR